MGKVYVVQEAVGKNILSASEFGTVEILLPPGQIVFSTEPTVRTLREKLRTFNDDDYLLLMGDPAAIGFAAAIAANYNGGSLNLLKFDRQEKIYFPVRSKLF